MAELGLCGCGYPLADAGPIGIYCTNKNCPVEAEMTRLIIENSPPIGTMIPKLEYNELCECCQRNKITIEVFTKVR